MSSVHSHPRGLLVPPPPERSEGSAGRSAPLALRSHTSPPDVTVCIANWNCRDLLYACLKSLHGQPQGVRVETVVVDNASADGAADMVARDFPDVLLVRNERNLGFAAANNQAADLARGRYLFFLNNDTIVPANTLRRLLTFAEAHPEIGMIGPRLRDACGALQISYRRRPTVGALLHRTMLLRWTGLLRDTYHRYRRGDFDPKAQRCVDVLMGAAVMLPQEVFFECGRWDEAFAFGGEDIDLSVRVGRRHAVVYLPQIEITHHGRVSSRLNVTFAEPNVQVGYVRFLRKAGAGRAALVAYKLVVTCDAPVHCLSKWVQYAWRRITGRPAKAEKSRLAMWGLAAFLTRGLINFWRA